MSEKARVIHVPPADVTGLNSPRCQKCEYPLDHRCSKCGVRVCITKGCAPHLVCMGAQ